MSNLRILRGVPGDIYDPPSPGWGHAGGEADLPAGFARWMDQHGLSARTLHLYYRTISRLEEWLAGHRRTSPPDWETLRLYADTLPFTYASRQQLKSAVAKWWEFLGRKDCPAWAVRSPKKPPGVCRAVDANEMGAVLEAAGTLGPLYGLAVALLYYMALRRMEAARARWDDLLPGGWLRVVGKGSREATLPLHEQVAARLAAVDRVSPWLLTGRGGTHISPATLNNWVRIAGALAGIPHLTPHQLRHTSLATFHDATGDLRATSVFARHADTRPTMVYTRTLPATLRKGMAAL